MFPKKRCARCLRKTDAHSLVYSLESRRPSGPTPMQLNLALTLVAITALLIFSAFFSGSETALTAVSKARMHHLASEGSWRAKQVSSLIGDREKLIGALLLGNTFVNILASALATSISLQILDEGGIAVATFA